VIQGVPATPFEKFRESYEAAVKAWGDPSYAEFRSQIEQAIDGIARLEASPGTRAAMHATNE